MKCEYIMLQQWEETQIHRGIDEIMHNLRHIPTDDVAYFLVKFNPNLAEELVAAIEQRIFDKNEGKKYE
jgi:hypothetical protein|tara:strand:+ start:449 stop:655 length:207 start_codon:yes stop_codon:yes gene_type:complete